MSDNKITKKKVKKTAEPKIANTAVKPDTFVGKSADLSFKKALKDALTQAGKHHTGNYKFEVIKMEYEKAAVAKNSYFMVTIKKA